MKIEALHQFHDQEFSQNWSDKFEPTQDRLDLFETITDHLTDKESYHILELGIGPGYLADYILNHTSKVKYEGLDFSAAMLKIATERNMKNENRIIFTQADLVKDKWGEEVKNQPNAIVSTWALHDLFNKESIKSVYQSAYVLLPIGGILLNGDFIKPEESTFEYEGGRIKPSEHIEILQSIGFQSVKVVKEFEKDILNPTTANKYSLMMATK